MTKRLFIWGIPLISLVAGLLSSPRTVIVAPQRSESQSLPVIEETVLGALATGPLTRADLRARLHVRNERLGETLTRLTAISAVCRVGDCWAIPNSDSGSP